MTPTPAALYDPRGARCAVHVFREGLLAIAGHDLELELEGFELVVDGASARASFPMDRVAVVGALEGDRVKEGGLSAKDRRDILANVHTVLDPKRHPEARFETTHVEGRPGGDFDVTGALTLAGKTRELHFKVVHEGAVAIARVPLRQTDFGLKPYRAALGGLRVRDEVIVTVTVPYAR